jgi:hypothetical protein
MSAAGVGFQNNHKQAGNQEMSKNIRPLTSLTLPGNAGVKKFGSAF